MDPSNSQPDPYKPAQPRRPRGFAATPSSGGESSKREREKEKERTKLRERHRRAITSRMLAGLRQYGNFPLPARADMNDVLAALAREAGWTVDLDGTTYRAHQAAGFGHMLPPPKESSGTLSDASSSVMVRIDGSLSPPAAVGIGSSLCEETLGGNVERFPGGSSPINSVVVQCLDADQLINDNVGEHGNGFVGSPYIPLYVMLASGFVNNFGQLINEQGLREELSHLKSLDVDGVSVDCWWGIVEAWNPQKYEWSGYRQLFNIVRDFKLKLQVVMSFHEYGGSDALGPLISLPQWILEIGKENQDIFFTDREGRRNTECLSWSVDKERVLKGRTGIEVYSDFMRSFRTEFDDLFIDGLISSIEVGLGASGELKYPSFSERMGWSYPGIGEFQCYDRYFQQNLRKAAKLRGHSFWARGPDNAGHYNSRPNETGFFCDRGDYDSYYGRFFLQWYAQSLIDHAENVLSLASLTFEDTNIVVKIPAAYWWYKTASHAAELTAGYYNPSNRDGYSSVFKALKKYSVTIKIACSGMQVSGENDAFADPEGLGWQVLNSAWDLGLGVAGVNMLSCYDREGYMRVVGISKPKNDPDHHHFSLFVYQQPSPLVQGAICFPDLVHFIKCMHGEIFGDDLLS